MKQLIFLLTVMACIFSCSNPCSKLYRHIQEAASKGNGTTIHLKEVYTFKWDTLYIFQPYLEPEDIARITGSNCDCKRVPEGERLFLFVQNGVPVQKSYVECRHFFFSGQDNPTGFFTLSAAESHFELVKFEDNRYMLKPAKDK